MSGNDSPGLIQNPPTDIIQNTRYCTDDDVYPEKLGDGGYADGDIQYPRVCVRNNDNRLYPKLTGCCHTEDMDFLSPAACYDCTCLMSLIWITTSLSSDGEGTVNRTGHDGCYDCSPAGKLGCLPRRLCVPWVIEGMTQLLTKINRPYSDILFRETMYDSGRRCVRTSDTPPAAHPAAGRLLALIGRRASVGGSVGRADWPRSLGTVDNPPGGVWIAFIRRTLEDSQSIVAVPVTG